MDAVFRGSAKLYPVLSLGSIISFAKSFQGGSLLDSYEFLGTFYDSSDDLKGAFEEHGPGVYLFSNYLWSLIDNAAISREVKQWDPRNLTVFGGPSVPVGAANVASFLDHHPSIDICVRGEGEVTCAELLEVAAAHDLDASGDLSILGSVDGVAARTPGGVVCAEERQRTLDLTGYPSPYLTGTFDDEPVESWSYATLETNRGCPYHCTYCNWGGATAHKVCPISMDRVLAEIEWIASRRISRIYIVDANFGILDRDVEIARAVAEAKRRYGFPLELSVSYGQTSPARLSEIIEILTESGVATVANLAFQTLDPATLECVGRRHVKMAWVEEVVDAFRKLDQNLCSDILVGLPGGTVSSIRSDLQFCFDNRISVTCYPVYVLPNTPMAEEEYQGRYRIEVDRDGFIVSTSTFSRSDREEMNRLVTAFQLFVLFGVLKYVLWYLQLDHGLEATRVIHDLSRFLMKEGEIERPEPPAYRAIRSLLGELENSNLPPSVGDWGPFYHEVCDYVHDKYGIPVDSGFKAALAAQAAVMPVVGRELPMTISLEHDFPAFYRERVIDNGGSTAGQRLSEYHPADLSVDDPNLICENLKCGRIMSYGNVIYWELETVMTPKNTVPFVARAVNLGAVS